MVLWYRGRSRLGSIGSTISSRVAFRRGLSSSRGKKVQKQDFDYCVDLVQNRDREGYLCGLLMPHQSRRSYFAIRALNVELASIKDGSVSRQAGGAERDEGGANMALKVRIQWWRDAIGQIYGDDYPSSGGQSMDESFLASMAQSTWNNPVVRVLDHAVKEKNLTRRFLERLLEAREDDLDVKQLNTMDEVVDYGSNTFSSLLYLSLETADVREDASDAVAYHAGVGMGIVTALRGARLRLSRGECTIPRELIPKQFPYHKFNAEDPRSELSEEELQMLREAVREMVSVASSHLSLARELQLDVPRHARPCFLPVVPSLHFLSRLEKSDFNIFDDRLLEPDQLRVLLLLGRAWLGGVF